MRAPRITTYPGRGPDGSDRRYVVGPVAEARALVEQTLAANPGARIAWEDVNPALDRASFEIIIPQEG